MQSLRSLLIIYFGPPLLVASIFLFIASWLSGGQREPMAAEANGVKKGGRIASQVEMFR
jgi:hypothetical protein